MPEELKSLLVCTAQIARIDLITAAKKEVAAATSNYHLWRIVSSLLLQYSNGKRLYCTQTVGVCSVLNGKRLFTMFRTYGCTQHAI